MWYQYRVGTALFTTTKSTPWFSVGNQQFAVSLCDFGTSQCIMRDKWQHLKVLSPRHESEAAFLTAKQKKKISFFLTNDNVPAPTTASSAVQPPSANWKSRHGRGPDICQPLTWQLTSYNEVTALVIHGGMVFSALLREEMKKDLSSNQIMNLKYGHFDWALTPGDRVSFSPSVQCVAQYGHPYGVGLLINLANSVIHLRLLSFPLKLNWLKHTAKRLSLHW